MTTLYLHIGMQKTGTTSLQAVVRRNAAWFRARRVAVPTFLGPNHGDALLALYEPTAGLEDRLAAAGRGFLVRWRDRIGTRLLAFLADAKRRGDDVLLTGEAMTTLSADGWRRLEAALGPGFDRIVVVAFVRPPAAFADSVGQERLVNGRGLSDLVARPPRAAYRRFFRPAIGCFGESAVRFRLFHRDHFRNGSLLETFLAAIDRAGSGEPPRDGPRLNASVSLPAGKLLACLNDAMLARRSPAGLPPPVLVRLREGAYRRAIADLLARDTDRLVWPAAILSRFEAIPGPPFRLPAEVWQRTAAIGARDVLWMSERIGLDVAALEADRRERPDLAAFGAFDPAETASISATLAAGPPTWRYLAERHLTRGLATGGALLRLVGRPS